MSGDEIVRANWGLAKHAARKVARRDCDFGPAFSDALLGLWCAVLTYRPERGRFSAHAGMCIQRSIIDGLRQRHGRPGSPRQRALRGMRSLDAILRGDG